MKKFIFTGLMIMASFVFAQAESGYQQGRIDAISKEYKTIVINDYQYKLALNLKVIDVSTKKNLNRYSLKTGMEVEFDTLENATEDTITAIYMSSKKK